MSVGKRLQQLEHFYFCFLVACKIRLKQQTDDSEKAIKIFMDDWLTAALDIKFFDGSLLKEIVWLKYEILIQPSVNILRMLDKIHCALLAEGVENEMDDNLHAS